MASLRGTTLTEGSWRDSPDNRRGNNEQLDNVIEPDWTRSKEPVTALVSTIEGEVIPRLLLAHMATATAERALVPQSELPGSEEIASFTKLVLEEDVTVASAYAQGMLDRGVPLEALFLGLFAQTARRLGELWVADLCDFTQVTIGVGRLQQLLREFARSIRTNTCDWVPGRRALLAPTPGEQHTFGMLIVGEFLRRAGWDVTGEPAASREQLCDIVRDEWYGLVGLSLSSESHAKALMRDIRAIRRASRNEDIGVIVGGRVFAENPELATRVKADAMAVDGREAVDRAEELLARSAAVR